MTVRVSVVIPVYNQWDGVPLLLAALMPQLSAETEVVLVDNGSDDPQYPKAIPANIMIVSCSTPGSYAARNFGVSKSSGEILVFTDADCIPRTDWLRNIVERLGRDLNAIIAGEVAMVGASQAPNRFEMYDILRGIPQKRYVSKGYAATANLATSRALFDKVGGFDASRKSGGDADFCRRSVAAGTELVFCAEAVVEHPARSTWDELVIKTRRIKGGQLNHQRSVRRKLLVILRTLFPPVLAVSRFARDDRWPVRYRANAIGVQLQLWWVEVAEVARLLAGKVEERR
ncbi:glycosyltransferase [Devosia sp. 2618]|uniref:glycosyltransferase family 2 protein n=1 Tax=Devosia sp. 2618 TaxID=3156454 RepID=UPI003395BBEC